MQNNAFFPTSLYVEKTMRFILFLLVCFSFYKNASAQQTETKTDLTINVDELTPVAGNWIGSLSYLDYSSNKEVSIDCNLNAKVVTNKNAVNLSYVYPQEMNYNSSDLVKITQQGTHLDNSKIIEKKYDADGVLYLVTEEKGKDDNRPATIQYVITISAQAFSIAKMVKFEGQQTFFRRNVYSWNRA